MWCLLVARLLLPIQMLFAFPDSQEMFRPGELLLQASSVHTYLMFISHRRLPEIELRPK